MVNQKKPSSRYWLVLFGRADGRPMSQCSVVSGRNTEEVSGWARMVAKKADLTLLTVQNLSLDTAVELAQIPYFEDTVKEVYDWQETWDMGSENLPSDK